MHINLLSAAASKGPGGWIWLLVLLGAIVLIPTQVVWANGPPIQTETAFTTGLNGSAVRTFAKAIRKSGEDGQVDVLVVPVVVPYEAVDNKFILGLALPVVNKTLSLKDGTERSSGFGIGDLAVFGKVNLYQSDAHQETFRVAGKLALTLPTGEYDASDEGGLLPPGLQRGSGSVNPSVMLIATWIQHRLGLNADVGFTALTERGGIDAGDILQYDLAVAYRVLPWIFDTYPDHQISLMLEFNGTLARQSRVNGERNLNSGGHTLFISPGLQYMYGSVMLEASVQLPLPGVTRLDGEQLTPDWTANAGLRWLID